MTTNDALISDYLSRLEDAARELPADRRAELIEEISAHIAEARAQGAPSIAGPDSDLLDLLDLLARLGDPAEIVRAASDSSLGFVGVASASGGSGGIGMSGERTVTAAVAGEAWAARTAAAARASGAAQRAAAASGADAADQARSEIPYYGPPGRANTTTAGAYALPDGGTLAGRPGVLEITAVILSVGSVVFLLIPALRVLALVGWLVGVVLLWYSPRWSAADKILGTLVWPVGLSLAILLTVLPTAGATSPHVAGLFAIARLAELSATIAAVIIITVRLLRRAGRAPA